MKPRVYLETTIVSYLTALPSRNIMLAAHQQMTRRWWARRDQFDLFVSDLVWREAERGDLAAAARRIAALAGIRRVDVNVRTERLASRLLIGTAIPDQELNDALHVAAAVIGGANYLLTWNCAHIANASARGRIKH